MVCNPPKMTTSTNFRTLISAFDNPDAANVINIGISGNHNRPTSLRFLPLKFKINKTINADQPALPAFFTPMTPAVAAGSPIPTANSTRFAATHGP